MKKILNEYDDTKRMLNALRGFSKTNTLNEQVERGNEGEDSLGQSGEETKSNVDNINSVDVKLISSDEVDLSLEDDQRQEIANLIDSFREQISQTANLEPGFTFLNGQGRLDGVIPEHDIKFTFIAGEQAGVYLNAQMLKLENETVAVLEKLVRFQEQFNASIDTIIRVRRNN